MALTARVEDGISSLSQWALRQSTVQNFLICSTAAFFLLWKMSELNNDIREISSLPILDSRSSYTPKEVYTLLRALGSEGRSKYAQINLYDFAFPLTLTSLLAVIIGPLYQRAQLWSQANMFPLVYYFFDIAENSLIRYLLYKYPTASPAAAFFAGEFTKYKYRFFYYTLAVIAFGLAAIVRLMVVQRFGRQHGAVHTD